jgi:surfeit locus 1 family protein
VTATWRRGLVVPTTFAICGLAVLISLGIWQLARKQWKEALIETFEQRLNAAPIELPSPSAWEELTRDNSEFLHVRLRVDFRSGQDALVYTSGSALRDDIRAPGYFVFTPARLADGSSQIVINRGYVAGRSYPARADSEEIVGYLRWPEAPSWFVAAHDSSDASMWHVRNQILMAQVKQWGKVAPFYIDEESPMPAGGWPRPGPLKVQLRNEHLQYALTWFGLAGVIAVAFLFWLRSSRAAA